MLKQLIFTIHFIIIPKYQVIMKRRSLFKKISKRLIALHGFRLRQTIRDHSRMYFMYYELPMEEQNELEL